MNTVAKILETQDVTSMEDMALNDHYKIHAESDAFMDLDIEKVLDNQLSVAHYYTQRGDLMRDPEIVYEIGELQDTDTWTPIIYRQDGFPQVYEIDESGLGHEVQQFAENWNQNLKEQGFYEQAVSGDLEAHLHDKDY